jgi:hypothetical protein
MIVEERVCVCVCVCVCGEERVDEAMILHLFYYRMRSKRFLQRPSAPSFVGLC